MIYLIKQGNGLYKAVYETSTINVCRKYLEKDLDSIVVGIYTGSNEEAEKIDSELKDLIMDQKQFTDKLKEVITSLNKNK